MSNVTLSKKRMARRLARLVEAVLFLFMVRMLLAALPFKLSMRIAGLVVVNNGSAPAPALEEIANPATAIDIGRAVTHAARYVPFRAVCLQQAIACAIMLRLRKLPVSVCFGVAHGKDGALKAHAWSKSGTTVLTGAQGIGAFTPIATFRT